MTAQDTFFGQHSFEHGIMISYRGEAFLFFSQLSILIADEVAIKQSVESKGAAGKLFCSRCSNVISKYSWDNAVDTTGLVHGACTDVSQAHQRICAEGRQVLGGAAWEIDKCAVRTARDPVGLQLETFWPPAQPNLWPGDS